jgi:transcriptional regulator with XRE-family HTH domain
MSLKAQRPVHPAYPPALKTLGDHLRRRRMDLKLSQEQVATKLGASETSILNWEKNRRKPSLPFIPKIVEFLGYVPYISRSKTLGEKILAYRKSLGISQEKMARSLGVDPGTLGRWERGEKKLSKKSLKKLEKLLIRASNLKSYAFEETSPNL